MFVKKNEDSSKTENRSWKEHHGECLPRFLKRKMWLEKGHQEVLMTNYKFHLMGDCGEEHVLLQ